VTDSPQWQRDRARIVKALRDARGPVRLDLLAQYLGLAMSNVQRHAAQLATIEWVRTIEYLDLTATGHQALATGVLEPDGSRQTIEPVEIPIFEITQEEPVGTVLAPPGGE